MRQLCAAPLAPHGMKADADSSIPYSESWRHKPLQRTAGKAGNHSRGHHPHSHSSRPAWRCTELSFTAPTNSPGSVCAALSSTQGGAQEDGGTKHPPPPQDVGSNASSGAQRCLVSRGVLERRLRLSLVSSTFPEPTPVALCLPPPPRLTRTQDSSPALLYLFISSSRNVADVI